eukprot:11118000-Ditylum_brightwellii.AAC.1
MRDKLEKTHPSAGCTQMRGNLYKRFQALWRRCIWMRVVFKKAYFFSAPKCFGGVFYSAMGALLMLRGGARYITMKE